MNIRRSEDVGKYNLPNYIKKQIKDAFGEIDIKKKSKYKNIIVEIDGIKFRSKREGQRYCDLKMLMRCGVVKFFEMQVPYEITKGIKKRRYFLDFKVFWSDGHITHEDVKGKRTDLYSLKKDLIKDIYNIDIVEI
jgi:hypothetical protein